MTDVYTIGELLVEIMRPVKGAALSVPGPFAGPFPSGAPAIFINAAAKLGLTGGIVGAVGDDAFGRCVTDRLRQDGVDCSRVVVSGENTTGMAFVTYQQDGSRDFLFHLTKSAAVQVPRYRDLDFVRDARAFHISGSSLFLSDDVYQICVQASRAAKEGRALVSLDPNVRRELAGENDLPRRFAPFLDCADVLLPSGEELELLTGLPNPEDAVRQLFRAGIRYVVQKCGEAGCVLYVDGAKQAEAPGYVVDAVDPTGAGDCFDAAVVYGLLHDWEWDSILPFANAVGALATTALGPMEGAKDLKTVLAFMSESIGGTPGRAD